MEEEQETAPGQTIRGTPGNDSLVGTPGDDTILGGAGDDQLFGNGGNNLLKGEEGNDNLVGGTGNDTMFGGPGDDVFIISDDFGNHLITGGETDEVDGDIIAAAGMTQDVAVTYTGDEMGTITRAGEGDDPAAEINFSEIERMFLGSGDDVVTVDTSTTGLVSGGEGFDTLVLPDPADGEGAPQVTVTSRV
ncbi:MAG: calcium-binding protein, partial [Pararhodobacter sp.]